MSNVTLTSNGDYWLARWQDSNGRRRGQSLGKKQGTSKRKALLACHALAAEHLVTPASRDAGRGPTLKAWCDQFIELSTSYSPGTVALYEGTIKRLLEYFSPDQRIGKITRLAAAQWRTWLASSGITESTVRKHVRNAKTIFKRAGDLDLVKLNPFDRELSAPVDTDHDWYYLDKDGFDALLAQCQDDGFRCLFGLCRLAGLRLGEALRLQFGDIDWDRRTLDIKTERGVQGTKQRRRTVPVVPLLYEMLFIRFGTAQPGETVAHLRSGRRLYYQANLIITAAGLTKWPKLFHTLRQNAETDWKTAGHPIPDVCQWMGHAAVVAARHYHAVREDSITKATGQDTEVEQLRRTVADLTRQLAEHAKVF